MYYKRKTYPEFETYKRALDAGSGSLLQFNRRVRSFARQWKQEPRSPPSPA